MRFADEALIYLHIHTDIHICVYYTIHTSALMRFAEAANHQAPSYIYTHTCMCIHFLVCPKTEIRLGPFLVCPRRKSVLDLCLCVHDGPFACLPFLVRPGRKSDRRRRRDHLRRQLVVLCRLYYIGISFPWRCEQWPWQPRVDRHPNHLTFSCVPDADLAEPANTCKRTNIHTHAIADHLRLRRYCMQLEAAGGLAQQSQTRWVRAV